MSNFKLQISNLFLILFLLLIPTQLGKHFWSEWSLISGVRSDYLSPTLYLIDLVWLVWIISNFKFRITNFKVKKEWIVLGVFALINILLAGNWQIALYKWGRILQFMLTVNLVTSYQLRVTNYLKWIIPIWIGVESLLGLSQLINGGSLQGIWYWLGERRFELTTPGIAQMAVLGRGLVRAYGTFSHPNSMAGFMLISIVFWNKTHPSGWAGHPPLTRRVFAWVVNWLAILGIVISGSRTVWMITLLLIINYELRITSWKQKIGYGVLFGGVGLLILGMIGQTYKLGDFVGGWDGDGWNKRMNLNYAAIRMILNNSLFGVGAGNFIVKLPEYNMGVGKINWWQPVHNIILLLISEVGFLGVVILILNLKFQISNILRNKKNWWILGIILITGMVDHYWLTLPQNMWLLAVLFGLMIKPTRPSGTLP